MLRTFKYPKSNFRDVAPIAPRNRVISGYLTTAAALGLSGCGSSDSATNDSASSIEGLAIKGLLNDSRIFFDSNGNGTYDQGEDFTTTDATGAFSLQGDATYPLTGEVTATTVDGASGRIMKGFFAAAPSGATVMTPMTTVLAQTDLSETELRQALGLSVDQLHYNPFQVDNVSTTAGRDAEHVAQQIANITRALTGFGVGTGLDARTAFDLASNAFNSVLIDHVSEHKTVEIELWGDETIRAVMAAYRPAFEDAGGATNTFDIMQVEIGNAIDLVNQRILAVADITSTEARAVFGLPSDLYDEIQHAAAALTKGETTVGLSLDSWNALTRQISDNGYNPPAPDPTTLTGPAPVLTVNAGSTITVQSDIDAILEVTGGGVLGNLVGGNAVTLSQQAAITTGTLFARANGQTSAVTSQTFTIGTNSNDTLDSTDEGARVDFVVGGEGNDTISTGAGNDHILGGAGNDIIDGGAGADTVTGGSGNDTLSGGVGDDTFTIAAAAHHAAGEDVDGDAGNDTIRFTSTTANETLTLNAGVTVETIEISDANGDNAGTVNLNIDASNMAADQNVGIIGNAGNNSLTGNGGDNVITGGSGDDTITGGDGADELIGGDGDDIFIIAPAGKREGAHHPSGEIIDGGIGEDTIRFTATRTESLILTEDVKVEAVIISDESGNSGGTSAAKIDASAVIATENITLRGDAGDNELTGNDGDNLIFGGAGNDDIRGGAGSDRFNGGDGNDTFFIELEPVGLKTIEVFETTMDKIILEATTLTDRTGTAIGSKSITNLNFATLDNIDSGSGSLGDGDVIVELLTLNRFGFETGLVLNLDLTTANSTAIIEAAEAIFAGNNWGGDATSSYIESSNAEDLLFILYEASGQGLTRDAALIRATGDGNADSFDGELSLEAILTDLAANTLSSTNFTESLRLEL